MSQMTQFGEAELEVYAKVERVGKEPEFYRVTDPTTDEDGNVTGGTHTQITEAEYKAGAES